MVVLKDIGTVRRELKKAYKTLKNQGDGGRWEAIWGDGRDGFSHRHEDYEPADAVIRTKTGAACPRWKCLYARYVDRCT